MSAVLETTSTPVAPTAAGSPPPVMDVAALLAPIPGDNPAGENLKYSGIYDEIREARRVASFALRHTSPVVFFAASASAFKATIRL